MDVLAALAIVFGVIGILGGIVPGIPGPPLSWVALLFAYFSDSIGGVSEVSLIVWFVVAAVVTILDFILPGKIAKVTGGHKAAEWGALIGLFAGIIFTPVGMLLGCFLGALLGELLVEGQDVFNSLKAAAGAFIGVIVASGIKIIVSAIIMWRIVIGFF